MLSDYLRILTKRPHNEVYKFFSNLHAERGTVAVIGHNDGKPITNFRIYNRKYNIVVFEKNPFMERQLKAMAWVAGKDYQYHLTKLGKRQSSETLFLPRINNKRIVEAATSDRDTIHLPKGADPTDLESSTGIDEVVVPTQIFDSLRLAVDVVIISPDHFEFDVLEGMKVTIERSQPIFLLPNLLPTIFDAHEFLESRKYVAYHYDPSDNTVEPFDNRQASETVLYVHRNLFEATQKTKL